jgi:hypothetical protein
VFELVRIGMPDVRLCRCFTAAEAAECWHALQQTLYPHEWAVVFNEGSNVTDFVLEDYIGHTLESAYAA